jgi:hypothetical protein
MMKKHFIAASSLLALVMLSGPSVASLPCDGSSADGAELICFCPPGVAPGGAGCRCTRVAIDETGMEVY